MSLKKPQNYLKSYISICHLSSFSPSLSAISSSFLIHHVTLMQHSHQKKPLSIRREARIASEPSSWGVDPQVGSDGS